MADKEIAMLPMTFGVTDDTLIPAYQPGAIDPAQHITGAQLRRWVNAGGGTPGGADGYSPTAAVYQTVNGAVIVITDKYGSTTATVKNGKNGADGVDATPVTPLFANTIEECTDITKPYVLPDGYIYAYLYSEGKNEITYTNRLDGLEITPNTYLSSSSGNTSNKSGYSSAGFIPIGAGSSSSARGEQVIRLQDIAALPGDSYTRVLLYKSDKTFIVSIAMNGDLVVLPDNDDGGAKIIYNVDSNGYINYLDITGYSHSLIASKGEVAYFRFCAPSWGSDAIVTVNEEIKGGATPSGYSWANTGHAFVPADYEDRVIAVEKQAQTNAENLSNLSMSVSALLSRNDAVPYAVQEAASAVVDKAMSREGNRILRFLISTDAHQNNENSLITKGTRELGQAQGEILKLIGVDFVANLGDIAWGAKDNTVAQVVEQIKTYKRLTASGIKGESQLWCEGNHDDGSYSLTNYPDTPKLTASAINTLFYSENRGVVYDDAHMVDGYCYKDFEHLKVRVICLNTEQGTGDGGVVEGYQLKWFAETALDMTGKNDWSVITLAHHPLGYPMVTLFKDCVNIVDAFISGSNFSYTTTNGTAISMNFSGKNCQYVGHFHGHAHAFSVVKLQKYVGNSYVDMDAWEIGIPNACYTRNNQYFGNENARLERYSTETTYNKTDEDGKRTSFNIVTVCLDERKIFADNYGAGIDRKINY